MAEPVVVNSTVVLAAGVGSRLGDELPKQFADLHGTPVIARTVVGLQQCDRVVGVVLEACGPMGFEHNGRHDKTSLADWTAVQRALLSLCFCAACSSLCTQAGLDADEARARVRRAVTPADGAGAALAPPASMEQALGAGLAAVLQDVRSTATAELRQAVLDRARPGVRVTLHADPEPWSTARSPRSRRRSPSRWTRWWPAASTRLRM